MGIENKEKEYICQAELDKRFKLGLLRPKILDRARRGCVSVLIKTSCPRGSFVVVVTICRQAGKTDRRVILGAERGRETPNRINFMVS